MSIWHAFVLGLVQGITEFLPISSSGFLVFIPELFGWELQSVAFDGVIHLATLAAIVIALWDDIRAICLQRRNVIFWVAIGTIPIIFFGFLIQEILEISFRSLQVVAWSFVIWGFILFVVDRYARSMMDDVSVVGWKRSLAIGFAQVLAIIPGTSRSGITITAGMMSGLSRQTATTFSFLLGIPTILAAGILSLRTIMREPETVGVLPLVIGGLAAFLSALITVRLLRRWLGHGTYAPLAVLRILVGLFLLLSLG